MFTDSPARIRRLAARGGAALFTTVALVTGAQAAVPAAHASITAQHPYQQRILRGADTVVVTVPGAGISYRGRPVLAPTEASSSGNYAITGWHATGLPSGLKISSTGVISGVPTTLGCYHTTVTATDSDGTQGSDSFTWEVLISGPPRTCSP
jgi:hypothetical protein